MTSKTEATQTAQNRMKASLAANNRCDFSELVPKPKGKPWGSLERRPTRVTVICKLKPAASPLVIALWNAAVEITAHWDMDGNKANRCTG